MSFFKRRDPNASMIPPVAPPPGSESSHGPSSSSNNDAARNQLFSRRPGANDTSKSNVSDPYAAASNSNTRPPSYRTTAGDPYGDGQANDQRNELLGGFKPKNEIPKERKYGYEGREQEEDFDEDEEIEGIKQEMRGVKQESLASTRNALRLAREAEETGHRTLSRLGDQSERIANTERHLDIAKANNARAEDKANELRHLNRSLFKPSVTWNKEGKRLAQEEKIMDRHLKEREEREKARADIHETHRRLGQAADPRNPGSSRDGPPRPGQMAAKKEARSRYQFEATNSDDELEDELDDNLNETLEVTRSLKRLAMAAGEEIDAHNRRLTGINDKAGDLDVAIMKNTERVRRAGGKK